ncbi:MAG: GNAT family N-acetyltransferase [Ignavibacteriales bacterium]|nr:GNAT family N-acetyltransferase [Ignavibacteriales bacterium]
MSCSYRKALPSEIETLIDLRVEFLLDIHPDIDDTLRALIRKGTAEYLTARIAEKKYVGYFGIAEGSIVCSSGMLIHALPPLLSAEGRTIGHILNFFTRTPFRGKGYGYGLMEFIKTAAKEEGVSRLFLNATDMGYPLYAKCGFIEPDNKAMQIDL